MEIVDKEQERKDYENSPEGRKKKRIEQIGSAVVVIAVLGLLYLCRDFTIGGGKPYVVTIGSVEVKPGKTTVKDLADAGYDLTDTSVGILSDQAAGGYLYEDVYDLSSEAEPNTCYAMLVLVKDGEQTAELSVINDTAKPLPLAECIINEITVRKDYADAELTAAEGYAFADLASETAREAIGKAGRTTSDYTSLWERGDYSLYVETQVDGSSVSRITSTKYYPLDLGTGSDQ